VSSNHIPDVTKMIQGTPRTDAARPPYTELQEFVSAEFARTLERELNAANELIVRLQAVTNDPHALWANWLRGSVTLPVGIGDVRQYQERIKRLEDIISRAKNKFFRHGSNGTAASGMLDILGEVRKP
jgi:hypothetical protein